MAKTEVRGGQIKDTSVQRSDLDTSNSGEAVVRRIIAGTNITLGSTGADTGTGDVTINVSGLTEEITTTASSSTPTPTGGSLRNLFNVTALAANATFAAPSGTPANGNRLMIRIKDNGTARTITWNAIFRVIGVTLPTTTVISKTYYIGCVYNSADTKWDVLATSVEA